MGARIDADNLERGQVAMRKLAEGWRRDDMVDSIKQFRTKGAILEAVRHRTRSDNYYHIADSGEPANISPAANDLRHYVHASKTTADIEREEAAQRQNKLAERLAEIANNRPEGYFPTPIDVASIMLEHSHFNDGASVLEPSAGTGELAQAILSANSTADLMCIEIRPQLCDVLRFRGFEDVHCMDFLEYRINGPSSAFFDCIIMNPPFERSQDCEHVMHAYGVLKPGGRIVSVMSGALRSAVLGTIDLTNGKRGKFIEWLRDKQYYAVDVPRDSFKESGTGVDAVIVVIDKPAAPEAA